MSTPRKRIFRARSEPSRAEKPPRLPSRRSRRGGPGILLAAVVALGLVLALTGLGKRFFEALGLGGILLLAAIFSLILWLAWGQRIKKVLQWWNVALATGFLTLALFGVLSHFTPDLTLGKVSLNEATAGGSLGQALGGGTFGVLKIAALALAGLACVSPRRTGRFLAFSWPILSRLYKKRPLHKDMLAATEGGVRELWSILGDVISYPVRLALRRRPMPFRPVLRRRPSPSSPASSPSKPPPATLKIRPNQDLPEAEHEEGRKSREATPSKTVAEQLKKPGETISEPQGLIPGPSPQPPMPKWQLPSLSLLEASSKEKETSPAATERRSRLIEEALSSYGVEAKVVGVKPGPVITQFAIEPGWDRKFRRIPQKDAFGRPVLDRNGQPKMKQEEVSKTRVKVERITSLANDLALTLAAPRLRIEAPVPGQAVVGVEVPNSIFSIVPMRTVIESATFQRLKAKSSLALALGQGVAGEAVASDLAQMPHLLIAGATGSGKTVCLHSVITSLLMHNTPDHLRLLLIDPKRVEMTVFSDIPHLIAPVVVERDQAVASLKKVTSEMDSRFRKLALVKARNIEAYNHSPRVIAPLPYLVVVIDELADLMMTASEVVEPTVCRLAQLARATGIHLVVATQRPSVDVVTGLIKANFPCRISFAVASQVDSRTILDTVGAEKLLGKGDMLFLPSEAEKPQRLQGSLVSDSEIERVASFWRDQAQPHLREDAASRDFASLEGGTGEAGDPLLEKAKELAAQHPSLSTSFIQRRLRIGYPRAARLMDILEEQGLAKGNPEEPKENGKE